MPPRTSEVPEGARPFLFHGVQLDWRAGNGQGQGDCALCGKDGRFYVNLEDGRWDCKRCGDSGNPLTFLRKLLDQGRETTADSDYASLAASRRLLFPDTPRQWGLALNPLTGEWLAPAYNHEGKVNQIYRYSPVPGRPGRMSFMATPTLSHGLFGLGTFDHRKETIYLCEGPWDGMALWEVLRNVKELDGELAPTGSEAASLLSGANVLAVPGCNVFNERWAYLLGGKHLCLMYDNDHPSTHPRTGAAVDGGGYAGMRRACEILATAEQPPASVRYLRWGDVEYYDPSRPSGYDLRDLFGEAGRASTNGSDH